MNDQNRVTQEPVIAVGAGPAGCTAALLLADFGIPVTLLERHTQPHPLPRAVHLDDEVARTLDLDHGGGRATVGSPEYSEDIALRIVARP